MQVARVNFMNKIALSSATKNASCNRGKVRLVIQGFFAVITTASFILIVGMAMKKPSPAPAHRPVGMPPKCAVKNCRVICHQAPYYGKYLEDIVSAVADTGAICTRVTLELNSPAFINNTLPTQWLSRMRSNIYHLSISGGNLQHLHSGAFMTQYTESMEYLALENLHIKRWDTNSLLGLSDLKTLSIVHCGIDGFEENAVRAVDNTLEKLIITKSGYWDPVNVTGSKGFDSISVIDFSQNNFSSILGSKSFIGLEHCKVLYLNSCGIVSIGTGTFDYMKNIQVLYLHDNQLMTVPPGLFSNIVAITNPRPRISLQNNLWHCDCKVDDFQQLVRKEILLVDAKCMTPSEMNGKTFAEFDHFCSNRYSVDAIDKHSNKTGNIFKFHYNDNNILMNGTCLQKNYFSESRSEPHDIEITRSFVLISPNERSLCSLNKSIQIDVSRLATRSIHFKDMNSDYWLKFSYFLQTNTYNSIHIKGTETKDYGLLWFQSDCPNELYCIDTMPSYLQVYNVDFKARYTFCPIRLNTGSIEEDECVGYDIERKPNDDDYNMSYLNMSIYIFTVVFFFCFGAIIVYGVVRTYPTLLKGSKRILFVKHKMVDALVLPPKVPLRNDLINDTPLNLKDKGIFTLNVNEKSEPPAMSRMKSIRSNKSNTPSYISALQPDEAQLAEWRIRHHFNNNLTINSVRSDLSSLSWIYGDDSYHSLESDITYESLK